MFIWGQLIFLFFESYLQLLVLFINLVELDHVLGVDFLRALINLFFFFNLTLKVLFLFFKQTNSSLELLLLIVYFRSKRVHFLSESFIFFGQISSLL